MNATEQIRDTVSEQEQISQTAPAEERDSNGRFGKGNSGGPGNPFARQVGTLRKVLLNCVTEEEMAAIGNKLVDMAKDGNLQAIKLLFSYTLGKPEEAVKPDRLDMEEWGLFRELAVIPKEADAVALVPDQSLALNTARTMRPILAQIMKSDLQQDLANDREEAIQEEARQEEKRIRREQRREQKKNEAAKTGSSNGKTEKAATTRPSANGKIPPKADPSSNVSPSTNGIFGEKDGNQKNKSRPLPF